MPSSKTILGFGLAGFIIPIICSCWFFSVEATVLTQKATSSSETSSIENFLHFATSAATSTRRLRQSSDFDCTISRRQIEQLLDEETRTWLLDADAISDVDNDIQSIINCSEEGDVILLNVTDSVQLSSRVTVPWKLTLSAYARRSGLVRGVFPKTKTKTVIRCPKRDKGALFIQSADVLLANLVFEGCVLNRTPSSRGIVEVDACSDGSDRGMIRLHHVEFRQNELNRTAAFLMSEEACSDIEMIDVQFLNNTCVGVCGALLSKRNTLRDVRIETNNQLEDSTENLSMLYFPQESRSTIDRITATGNQGRVVHVDKAHLNLKRGTFVQNMATTGAALYAFGSSITVTKSRFEQNNATINAGAIYFEGTSAESIFICRDSVFANNSAAELGGAVDTRLAAKASLVNITGISNSASTGGCVYSKHSKLKLTLSNLTENSAIVNGGGVHCDSSTVTISESTVVRNSAERGGGIRLDDSNGTVIHSTIAFNNASSRGGGFYGINGAYAILHSTLRGNYATWFGAAVFCVEYSSLDVLDSFLVDNQAATGGAGAHVILDTNSSFVNTTFVGNKAIETEGGGVLLVQAVGLFDNCSFVGNRGGTFGGGVRVSMKSSCIISNTRFSENVAAGFGGAFSVDNSTVVVHNTSTNNNTAVGGGAAAISSGSVLRMQGMNVFGNEAAEGGGGFVSIVHGSWLHIADSIIDSNNSTVFGAGAFDMKESSLSISNCTIIRNRSNFRGGALRSESGSAVNITNSQFSLNNSTTVGGSIAITTTVLIMNATQVSASTAEIQGGGIFLEDSNATMSNCNIIGNAVAGSGGGLHVERSSCTLINSTVSNNIATLGAGGIHCFENSTVLMKNVTFTRNQAKIGAAMLVDTKSRITIVGLSAKRNSAEISGGVAFIHTESNMTVANAELVSNKASHGGDFFAFRHSRLTVKNTRSMNASARILGGSLVVISGSFIVMEGVAIEFGKAMHGGGIALYEAYFWGRYLRISNSEATIDGGGIHANTSSSLHCSNCVIEANSAVNKGGGIYLQAHKIQLLAFQFDNCSFVANEAGFGGGLIFVGEDDRSVDCSEKGADCTFVALRGTNFTNNRALSAGGGVHGNDLNAIRISCEYQLQRDKLVYLNKTEFETLRVLNTLENVCSGWKGNKGGDYGDDLASYAHRVEKEILYEETGRRETVIGNRYVVLNHKSGTPMPSIFLTAVDELNQGPAAGAGNESFTASMWSPDQLFTGIVVTELDKGTGNFSKISGYREPGIYRVRIDFSDASILPFLLLVEVRDCIIGEESVAQRTICQPCAGDTYNFFPHSEAVGCRPCPDGGICDIQVIRPKKGYWQSFPCSKNIQECLSKKACDHQSRDNVLKEIGERLRSCNVSSEIVSNYTQSECSKGYEGPLCGSCQESYGRSSSFRCEKCFDQGSSFIVVLLSVVSLLVLSTFAIRSSLPSHSRTSQQNLQGQVNHTQTSSYPITRNSPPVNLQMVQMTYSGFVPPEVFEQPQKSTSVSQDRTREKAEIAKWKAVEIFKITINYLQVIAVAISINVNWTEALVSVFETAEFIGGVTSQAATRSVDCLISSDSSIPRSAVRTVVNVMVPMLVTAIYFIFWAIAMIRLEKMLDYLLKRCILSFMAVSYLSYISITKTAVNVLYCIDVYDSTDLGSDSKTSYWAADTALKCYSGSHTVLAGLIGWPVLILFSFAFPVTIAYVLLTERKKHNMTSEWLYESTGFMYRAYAKEYVYWECIVMLRKAVLAVVVVFSYPLGGNLQGVLSVFVLMVALYFHNICSPFREEFDQLNSNEGLSLLISSITFVSGLFFNDERTSQTVRILLTIFIILANLGLFFYLLFAFVEASGDYLRTLLDAEGIAYDPQARSLRIIKTYIAARLREYYEKMLTRQERSCAKQSSLLSP